MSGSPRCANMTAAALRPLRDVELAQIAGRAGRHMNDGTFGTTIDVGGLDPETVEAIENHRFDPLRDLQWRNSDLDFRSVPALIASLNRPPPHAALQRVREQDDQLALQTLSQHSEFLPRLHAPQRVKLLWEVCQVPDFRKTMTEEHTRAARPALRASDPGRRAPARGLDRQSRQATGALRRRHRHVDGTHRACSDLDLHFAPPRLDSARGALAGARARYRGQAVRRAAPASDAKVCR